MDNRGEKVLKMSNARYKPYGLICLFALALCVCTEIPEHCGNNALRDPFSGQCKAEIGGGGNYDFSRSCGERACDTTTIGGKTWMAENLDYDTSNGSWCYTYNSKCNRLYNWETAMKVCPKGWKLPSSEDWDALISAAGGNEAGKKLKAASGWSNNGNGTDEYGFSAIPAGFRSSSNAGFGNAGTNGYWWTSTESEVSGQAYSWHMHYERPDVIRYSNNKSEGFSVRCLKN